MHCTGRFLLPGKPSILFIGQMFGYLLTLLQNILLCPFPRYMIDCFTLESLRPFPLLWQLFENKPRSDWDTESRKLFDQQTKVVKGYFMEFGVFIDLLMVSGGVMRKIASAKDREKLLEKFVPVVSRRAGIRKILEQIELSNHILRSKNVRALVTIETLKEDVFVPLGRLLVSTWGEIPLRPYQHVFIEHTQEMIERYRGIGPWATEGSESLNKYIRLAHENQSRTNKEDACVDVMHSIMMRNEPSIGDWMRGVFD